MEENGKIRVMLVDDHPIMRAGLAALLATKSDIQVVGEAPNGEAALYACASLRPHVVVMDLIMPCMNGVIATGLIRERFPEIQVVIFTAFTDEQYVRQALSAGALSYVIKNTTVDSLVSAIRAAKQHVSTFAPEATLALIRQNTAIPEVGHDLTEREQEVLILVAEGMSNHEIAQQLNISYSTVQFHVGHILSKLGVTNRVEAATVAIRQKIVE